MDLNENIPDDFKKCIDFHGHLCPGLAIGYRAARAGMDWLAEHRSEDEEIVAIVETDACSVDAIQVLTGCTFGKGNFIFKDNGKHVYTLLSRNSGKGVRISLKHDPAKADDPQRALMEKIKDGSADDGEKETFQKLRLQKISDILSRPVDAIFDIREADAKLPPKARMETSKPCAVCGEPTMPAKMIETNGNFLCRDCHGSG